MSRKIGIGLVVVTVLSSWLYLGLAVYKLKAVNEGLANDLSVNESKLEQTKARYQEKKAVETALRREKMVLQGLTQTLRGEADKLKAELEKASRARDVEVRRISGRLQTELNTLKGTLQSCETAHQKLEQDYAEIKKGLEEANVQLSDEIAKSKELDRRLNHTDHELKRCSADNSELSQVTMELIEKYREKSTGEPFTQIRQVEIEHMLQNYVNTMDKNQFRERPQ